MTGDAIAEYNIILYVSIALVFISYFSTMAMVNMVSSAPRKEGKWRCPPLHSGEGACVACASKRGAHRACLPRLVQDFGNDSLLYAKSKSD